MDQIRRYYVVEVVFQIPGHLWVGKLVHKIPLAYYRNLMVLIKNGKCFTGVKDFYVKFYFKANLGGYHFSRRGLPTGSKGHFKYRLSRARWSRYFRVPRKKKVDAYLIFQKPVSNPFSIPLERYLRTMIHHDWILVPFISSNKGYFRSLKNFYPKDLGQFKSWARSEFAFHYVSKPDPPKLVEPPVLFVPASRINDLTISEVVSPMKGWKYEVLKLKPGIFRWAYDSPISFYES